MTNNYVYTIVQTRKFKEKTKGETHKHLTIIRNVIFSYYNFQKTKTFDACWVYARLRIDMNKDMKNIVYNDSQYKQRTATRYLTFPQQTSLPKWSPLSSSQSVPQTQ